MKYVFGFLAVLAAVLAVSLFPHAPGLGLAMMVPMMPKVMGRRLLNRAIELNDGTWGPGGESLSYPVYDRMKMLNSLGVATRSLFKTAVGQQREGVTLTYADTNIEKSESIPSSQKWTFNFLNFYYLSAATKTNVLLQEIFDYMRTTTVRCIIDSKTDMFRVPLWRFGGATQIVSLPAVTQESRFPQAIFTGTLKLEIPIILQSLTDWELRIEPLVASNASLDNDFIAWEFEGRRDRKN